MRYLIFQPRFGERYGGPRFGERYGGSRFGPRFQPDTPPLTMYQGPVDVSKPTHKKRRGRPATTVGQRIETEIQAYIQAFGRDSLKAMRGKQLVAQFRAARTTVLDVRTRVLRRSD